MSKKKEQKKENITTIIVFENCSLECCDIKQCKTQSSKPCLELSPLYYNNTEELKICSKLKCSKNQFDNIKDICNNTLYNLPITVETDKSLKFGRYTGIFQLDQHNYVEILPKVKKNKEVSKENIGESRQIFENLLYAAHKIDKDVKSAPITDTKAGNTKLLEIFITLFCQEMQVLLKKGIRKYYSVEEDNLTYLKGKILFSQHIKYNATRQDKFYVEYGNFTENIAENRILKTACKYLLKETKNENNKSLLRRFALEFGDVDECINLDKDLSKIKSNRLFSHYDEPLKFAEYIIRKKNYIPTHGKCKLPALLFPLHTMFEDYIEKLLREFRKENNNILYDIYSQYNKHHLLNLNDKFVTKMDFVLKAHNDEKKALILDAKYKLIDIASLFNDTDNTEQPESENNYDNPTHISQADLYQVFTYSEILKQKENIENIKIALLYPKTDVFYETKDFKYFNGIELSLIPIDLTGKGIDDELTKNSDLKSYLEEFFKQ